MACNGPPVRRLPAFALIAAAMTAAPATIAASFSDVTRASGIDHENVCGAEIGAKGWLSESLGSGAAWLDYDGDGNLDVYLVNGSTYKRNPGTGEPNRLYRGDGDGHFEVVDHAGVNDRGWGYGATVGDIDNDGDPDIYVTNFGPNVLYRNNGDGTFSDVTAPAGVGNELLSTSAAFFDMEGDGDLDIYVANYMDSDPERVPRRGSDAAKSVHCHYKGIPVYCGPLNQVPLQDVLYRNNGDGTFEDATRDAGVWLSTPRFSLGVVSADYDNDGDSDLYVANDSVQNSLWQNDGKGNFTDVGLRTLSALNTDGQAQAGMGTDFGDYNGDGWLDLVVTNFAHDLNTVYRNSGGRFFIDDSTTAGLGVTRLALSWGTGFHDFDHDGDLDLFIANGHVYPQVDDWDLGTGFRQRNHLFLNDNGRFTESSKDAGSGLAPELSFRGAAFADYDNDGDMDLLLTSLSEKVLLVRNDHSGGGHYLQVRLLGTSSNRDAIGARVTVTGGERKFVRQRKGGGSFLSGSDPRLHFGLGDAAVARTIEIVWPGGTREVLENVKVDRSITVRQGDGIVTAP